MSNTPVKLIECPRDAMQGLHWFIPTEVKINYINSLLKVGYDIIDFGSFVSPKAIPQLRDTQEVLEGLDLSSTRSKLLAIVANVRGAETAAAFSEIDYLGFPFSISETFQQRNTNSSIEESLRTVAEIQNICMRSNKKLVLYLSMAFGNPYGDVWNQDIAIKWTKEMSKLGIQTIALSDTVGVAKPDDITSILNAVIPSFKSIEFGVHLHCSPENWKLKVNAAWESGCRRFDSAIKGFGGCPMAEDVLVGNLSTENLLSYLKEKNIDLTIDQPSFYHSYQISNSVFLEPLQHD
jgi:hydroxymethylglutaryl-CoA lyase